MYIEVDEKSVNDYKQKVIEEIKAKGELPEPVCERKIVSIDFSKESTKDVVGHGYDSTVPTCWILEGLVMYLKKEEVEKMYEEICDISPAGSLVIVNTIEENPAAASSVADDVFVSKRGWTKESQIMFGDDEFNYGRYPKDMAPSKKMGFGIY